MTQREADWAEKLAREVVIPWENFNINAWGEDMGSLARSHLVALFAQALRRVREEAIEEAAKVAEEEQESERKWMIHYEEKCKDLEFRDSRTSMNTAAAIANDIRALKDKGEA